MLPDAMSQSTQACLVKINRSAQYAWKASYATKRGVFGRFGQIHPSEPEKLQNLLRNAILTPQTPCGHIVALCYDKITSRATQVSMVKQAVPLHVSYFNNFQINMILCRHLGKMSTIVRQRWPFIATFHRRRAAQPPHWREKPNQLLLEC